jgi:hypothetical protein
MWKRLRFANRFALALAASAACAQQTPMSVAPSPAPSCELNEIQRTEGPNGPSWIAAVRGDFAGPPFLTLRVGSAHKTSWAIRNSAARPYIVLIIDKAGGREAPLVVQAVGARVDGISMPSEWGSGYGYNYDLVLPASGCWRVRWDGDPSRYLTYEVEQAQP